MKYLEKFLASLRRGVIGVTILGMSTLASNNLASAGPLPEVVNAAVEKFPSVMAAIIDVERAKATAKLLRVGPYEFQVNAIGTQRDINDLAVQDNRFEDWSIGLSRTIRLPNKRNVDKKLAVIELDLAKAKYQKTLIENQLSFIELWSTWRKAKALSLTSLEQAKDASNLAELERKKVKNGAGRQFDADRVLAESHLIELQSNQDSLMVSNAQIMLVTQFPELDANDLDWEFIPSNELIVKLVNTEILSTPEQRIAELEGKKNLLKAKRAKLDRVPDPTLGLSTFDEFDGRETGVLAQLSFPIPGRARKALANEANQVARISELNLEAVLLRTQQELRMAKQNATATMTSYQNAQRAIELSSKAMDRVTEGYSMGAMTISDVISARRVHQQIERAYQIQYADILRATLRLSLLSSQNPT